MDSMVKFAALLILVACAFNVRHINGAAVLSVDLGSEWMKVGVVSPGIPMEIALNTESKRKSPAVLSFKDGIRAFGDEAVGVSLKAPQDAFMYLLDLLGKNTTHPMVALHRKRFPYLEMETVGHVLGFKTKNNIIYTIEELIAQILAKAKEFAEQSADQTIKDAIIVVPAFFGQTERIAVLKAADLAGLKVLQLISQPVAVALNYGIFRRKDFNGTAQYVLFYDMGASATTAAIVSYQTVTVKEGAYKDTVPQLSVVGVGFDRTLGGLEMQIRLRDYLGNKFDASKKANTSVFNNPRAMAKLLKEAGRLKNVLSANVEHSAQIEGLLEDQDFKHYVKREEFEAMIEDLLDRVKGPVEQALATAGLSIDVIDQIVLVGAGTRVPKVQERLKEFVGRELSRSLNTDEAAALGAVYKAADVSIGFQVKKFITRDAVLYPIQVSFDRHLEEHNTTKSVRRTLFGPMNPTPQKKVLTFNKHTTDFTFNVDHGELHHLNQEQIAAMGALNISQYDVTGLAEALNKHKGAEIKGVKAHFYIDESGLLYLSHTELLVEKNVTDGDADAEGAFSKLGSTISKFFSSNTDEMNATETATSDTFQANHTVENNTATPITEQQDKLSNETSESKQEAKLKAPQPVIHKELLSFSETSFLASQLSDDEMVSAKKRLQDLEKSELERTRRATAINNLETFIVDIQNRLDEEDYVAALKADDSEQLRHKSSAMSDWLYEDGLSDDVDVKVYEQKLEELKDVTRNWYARVWEHRERPEALNALKEMIDHAKKFRSSAENMTRKTDDDSDMGIFTPLEVETLDKLINETEEWQHTSVKEQNELNKSEPVRMTVFSIQEKITGLDREVKYLVHKIKMWRPKLPKMPKVNDTQQTNETSAEPEGEPASEAAGAEEDDDAKIEDEPDTTDDNSAAKGEDTHEEL